MVGLVIVVTVGKSGRVVEWGLVVKGLWGGLVVLLGR